MIVIAIGRLTLNKDHLLDEFADARPQWFGSLFGPDTFDQGANTNLMTTRARMMLGAF